MDSRRDNTSFVTFEQKEILIFFKNKSRQLLSLSQSNSKLSLSDFRNSSSGSRFSLFRNSSSGSRFSFSTFCSSATFVWFLNSKSSPFWSVSWSVSSIWVRWSCLETFESLLMFTETWLVEVSDWKKLFFTMNRRHCSRILFWMVWSCFVNFCSKLISLFCGFFCFWCWQRRCFVEPNWEKVKKNDLFFFLCHKPFPVEYANNDI